MTTKTCKKCDATKPIQLFNRDKSMSDGRRNVCAACKRIHDKPRIKEVYSKRNKTKSLKAQYDLQKMWIAL